MSGQILPDMPVQGWQESPSKASHTTRSRRKLPSSCFWLALLLTTSVWESENNGKGSSPNHFTSLPFYSKQTSKAVSATGEQLLDHSHACDRLASHKEEGGLRRSWQIATLLIILYFKEKVLICSVQPKCNRVAKIIQHSCKKIKRTTGISEYFILWPR